MHIVSDEDVDRVYMIEMREKFYMELCSKLSNKADLLDHLLKLCIQNLNAYQSLASLPPVGCFDSICYVRI